MTRSAVRPRRISWGLAVGLVELAALFVVAVIPALAHAALLSASPAPGEVTPPTLSKITLTFDSVLAPGSTVVLFTRNFLPVAGIVAQVEKGRELSVHLAAPLKPGTYTVQWTAVTLDGHSVEGSYQFGVSPGGASWGFWVPVSAGALVIGVLVVGGWWIVRHRTPRGHAKSALLDPVSSNRRSA